MITYEPLWKTMESKGFSTYKLIKKCGIANGTLYRMRKGKPITTETINQFCKVLDCRVEDIILFINDETEK